MAAGDLSLGEAAKAIGVSADTLRRWDRDGKLRTTRDSANRRRVPRREVERLSERPQPPPRRQRALRPQPLPGRRAVRGGRRRDGTGRDRGRAAPDHRRGHPRRRRGARPRPRRPRHRCREGHLGDGRAGDEASRGGLLAILVLALAGCGDDEETAKPRLTVSAAASLKGAFEEYAKSFDAAGVRYSFAGSDELAAQIRQGVKPDVYAAANTKLPDRLYEDGLVEKPTVFAGERAGDRRAGGQRHRLDRRPHGRRRRRSWWAPIRSPSAPTPARC